MSRISQKLRSGLFAMRMAVRRLRGQKITLPDGVLVTAKQPTIKCRGGAITMENGVQFRCTHQRARISALPGGNIVIGARTLINNGVAISSAAQVRIGPDCKFGEMCVILDTDYHQVDEGAPVRVAQIEIGRNVWLGRSVMVLPGVTIGDHSVIASGSIVTADVPEKMLMAGAPAKAIRSIRASDSFRRH
tara:strand:- start:2182 stop:2751 length:570 start_codon:yes stop_codon:yes gene_type:complete